MPIKLYKIKLTDPRTYKSEQHKDGYLYDPWKQKIALYSRGEAIKKARIFNGKMELTDQKIYKDHVIFSIDVGWVRDLMRVSGNTQEILKECPTLSRMSEDELDSVLHTLATGEFNYTLNMPEGLNLQALEDFATEIKALEA